MPARYLSRFLILLFDNDCSYPVPAKPTNTRGKHIDLENHKVITTKEGQSVPSEAVSRSLSSIAL